jgi:hypothetical protein
MNKIMKNVIISLFCCVLLCSCEKYGQVSSINLQGEYIIDMITRSNIDNSVELGDSVYYPGTTYINTNEVYPMDTIRLGFTKWHFGYNILSMVPIENGTGGYIWQKQYYYEVINYNSDWDMGNLSFNFEGSRRVFKIVNKSTESLTLRSSGQWIYGNQGPNVSVTLKFTRVGP